MMSPLGRRARARMGPPVPAPRGDQTVPFQRAMLAAGVPPAVEKSAAAMRSPLGRTRSAATVAKTARPPPKADHDALFQRAMAMAGLPPAVEKLPPAMRSPFWRTASA